MSSSPPPDEINLYDRLAGVTGVPREKVKEIIIAFCYSGEQRIDDSIRIVAAALRDGDLIYAMSQPARHHNILQAAPPEGFRLMEQGFLTSTGQFVGRALAFYIAWQAGQLSQEVKDDKSRAPILFSEDLW